MSPEVLSTETFLISLVGLVLSCLLGFLRSRLLLLSWPWRPFPSRLLLVLPRWKRFLSSPLRGPLSPHTAQGGLLVSCPAQNGPQIPSLALNGLLLLSLAQGGLLFLSLAQGGLLFLSLAQGGLQFLSLAQGGLQSPCPALRELQSPYPAQRGPLDPRFSPSNFFGGANRSPAVGAWPLAKATEADPPWPLELPAPP